MKEHITRRQVAIAVLLLAVLAWLLWPNRQLAHVQEMQRELANADLSPEQRREKFGELRAEMSKLSPTDRDKLRAEGRNRMEAEMSRYFGMTPEEKKAYLDRRIDQ